MKKILSIFLSLMMLVLMGACGKTSETADKVVYGIIYTSDDNNTRVEAMAIKDGTIIYTGDKDGVKSYISDKTEVLDYGESFITPGFIDGHCHIYVDAENQAGFILTNCKEQTQEAYLTMIKEYIEQHPDEEIYKGFGWLDSAFVGGTPTAEMLDEICSDKPIYIKSEDCHSCWVNTKMLELTGVNSSTQDPVGGVIEHDANGNPNGCFRDTAMDYLVKPYVPSYTVEQYEEILLNAQEKMLSLGYTAYDDVIIDPQSADNIVEAYYNLDKEGKLLVKINAAILVNNTDDYVEKLDHVIELSKKFKSDNFAITDVKIFMDGIVESKTAYVSEPYTDGTVGADRWPGEDGTARLYDLTKRINDAGLVAHFHAIGDAAITKALDALEYAQENSTNKNIRNCLTHFQMISDSDIERMAKLNVIAVANLGWAPSANEEATGNPNVEELNVGEERNTAMYPFKSMLDAGIKMSYATDYPAGPVLKPLYNIEAGITRIVFTYTSTLRNADECISSDEALHAMTSGGAYQLGREDEIGTLEVGKLADFIVLSQDITAIDPQTIYTTTTLLNTYVSGNCVYQAN